MMIRTITIAALIKELEKKYPDGEPSLNCTIENLLQWKVRREVCLHDATLKDECCSLCGTWHPIRKEPNEEPEA